MKGNGINEFIVVEGRDDTERVKTAVECDTIETNGSAINRETLAVIQNAQETRGVIVLTIPTFQVIELEILLLNTYQELNMPMSIVKKRKISVENWDRTYTS